MQSLKIMLVGDRRNGHMKQGLKGQSCMPLWCNPNSSIEQMSISSMLYTMMS